MRVQIIVQDEVLANMLDGCCRAQGCAVTRRSKGYDVLQQAMQSDERWDLVILDDELEDLDGESLLRAVERVAPQPRWLLLKGEGQKGAERRWPDHVFVVEKPVDFSALVEALRSLKAGRDEAR